MAEVRFAAAEAPGWADMAVTTRLDDLLVGDTTTGESASVSDSAVTGCRYLYASTHFTAQHRLGTVHSVTGTSWAITLTAILEAI